VQRTTGVMLDDDSDVDVGTDDMSDDGSDIHGDTCDDDVGDTGVHADLSTDECTTDGVDVNCVDTGVVDDDTGIHDTDVGNDDTDTDDTDVGSDDTDVGMNGNIGVAAVFLTRSFNHERAGLCGIYIRATELCVSLLLSLFSSSLCIILTCSSCTFVPVCIRIVANRSIPLLTSLS